MRLIAMLTGLCTLVLLPIATNIATNSLPQALQTYTWFAWPALAVLAPIAIGLAVLNIKSSRSVADNRATELVRRNRDQLLAEIRRVWINGYLRHSLHEVVRIELGLEEKPDAVSQPW